MQPGPATRVFRFLHMISAFGVLLVAAIICLDVLGRDLLNQPLPGTAEIVKNSVVAITFMQIPLAIRGDAMFRTTILMDLSGPTVSRVLHLVASLLGVLLFVLLVWSSWGPMIDAWKIGEYEGEGALRFPTYPIRSIVVLMSVLAAVAYAILAWLDFRALRGDPVPPVPGH
jgi:TRAP-type C4-dicarboxylate transport system permease small subunit